MFIWPRYDSPLLSIVVSTAKKKKFDIEFVDVKVSFIADNLNHWITLAVGFAENQYKTTAVGNV